MTWFNYALYGYSAIVSAFGGVHGWAIKKPGGRVDRLLHKLWRTECCHCVKSLPARRGRD